MVGGHSIKDDEIKLGFAITGLIDPAGYLWPEQGHLLQQLAVSKIPVA